MNININNELKKNNIFDQMMNCGYHRPMETYTTILDDVKFTYHYFGENLHTLDTPCTQHKKINGEWILYREIWYTHGNLHNTSTPCMRYYINGKTAKDIWYINNKIVKSVTYIKQKKFSPGPNHAF